MNSYQIQKPFLKWVGGKTQIIDKILSKFPNQINNYHEIFVGGGSVLLAILSLKKSNHITISNNIYAYDINKPLIDLYKHIQKNKDTLFSYVTELITEYDSIHGDVINRKPTTIEEAKTSKESYFYWLRQRYNTMDKTSVECAAIFMILNKTCFRGLYREGPNGFNVPYGHYKKTPTIITKKDLDHISELIQPVQFIHSDFRDSLTNVMEGDFMYLDPPYAPENSKSFVGYVADGFDSNMHTDLFEMVKTLCPHVAKSNDKNNNLQMQPHTKFVMSNAKVPFVLDHFENYVCDDILVRRAINSKNPESTAREVIIHN